MYMDVLLACNYVHHMHFWFPWKSEEGIGELELELWMIVNYHVDGGNGTQGLYRSKCS